MVTRESSEALRNLYGVNLGILILGLVFGIDFWLVVLGEEGVNGEGGPLLLSCQLGFRR